MPKVRSQFVVSAPVVVVLWPWPYRGRRLMKGAVLLIDEIERGLEPFRLRHVLQIIARALRSGFDDGLRLGQTILTTHSPIAICELTASSLNVVRCLDDGTLEVQTVHEGLQGLVRSQPEALLSRAALVAEGKTEEGLLRGLQSFFAGRRVARFGDSRCGHRQW